MSDLGDFCSVFGFTPADYWSMTGAEHSAIITAHNRRTAKR